VDDFARPVRRFQQALRRLGYAPPQSWVRFGPMFRRVGYGVPQTWVRFSAELGTDYIEQNTTEHSSEHFLQNIFQNFQNKAGWKFSSIREGARCEIRCRRLARRTTLHQNVFEMVLKGRNRHRSVTPTKPFETPPDVATRHALSVPLEPTKNQRRPGGSAVVSAHPSRRATPSRASLRRVPRP
jgi:hypothetical protein